MMNKMMTVKLSKYASKLKNIYNNNNNKE
jgi:hypothetical protein